MNNQTLKTMVREALLSMLILLLLIIVFLFGMSGTSWAVDYWLKAEVTTKTMPDSSVITMWGFAECTGGSYASCTPATVPGPTLTVPVGDNTLTIHLRNSITGPNAEPISLVIPGQRATLSPVSFTDGTGRQRVKSFTTETPADNSTTVTYTWNNVKAGTYLYQSGSHPAVQVQMGLYGAMKKDAAAGQAYDTATAYDAEAVLLFSEIDPALHSAVSGTAYGTPAYPSTLNYEPKYFLINGAPYSASSVPIPAGNAGSKALLRFLNAGLKPHVPTLNGLNLSLISEDGNKYLYPKAQYSTLLAAGKTMDAIVTPATYGSYALYDRKLALTNGAISGGGMLAYLQIGAGTAGGIGVFRAGQWYLDTNRNGVFDFGVDSIFSFGISGDKPVTGDWNGTGTAKIGVFRDGQWYLDTNGNGAFDSGIDTITNFGMPGDIPVTGNWTGTGAAKIGVVRGNDWYLDMNGNGVWDPGIDSVYAGYGIPGDVPVTGDWDGTGVTRIGVFRNGQWYLDMNSNGIWDTGIDAILDFGISGDLPVTGDWDGTGGSKIGVFRSGQWFLDTNGNGAFDLGTDTITMFGIGSDLPVAGKW